MVNTVGSAAEYSEKIELLNRLEQLSSMSKTQQLISNQMQLVGAKQSWIAS
jgi:hypothetical protein